MRKSEEGLTLIEVVLGLTISAVMFVLLLGAMRGSETVPRKKASPARSFPSECASSPTGSDGS
jgi:type II secretory pathway component PulJ